MKLSKPAVIALCLASLSAPLAAQQSAESKKWDQKSDFAKGLDQTINTPAKGKVAADPVRQKALDDAMKDDGISKPAPRNSSKASRATPQR